MQSLRWFDTLRQDVKYGIRTLGRSPAYTAAAALSLAMGIGANTAIFTFLNAAFLKPLGYPGAERIVAIRQQPVTGGALTPVHPRSFVPWRERAQSFASMAIAQAVPVNTEGADGAEQVPGLWVTPNFTQVFGVTPFLGREFADAENAVILSHGYWLRRFGEDMGVVGRMIPMGKSSAVVAGVMPKGFRVGAFDVDLYQPLRIDPARPEAVGSRSFSCFARLRDGATVVSARAEMEALAAQVGRDERVEREFRPVLMPLREELARENRPLLLILAGVVALVLLIACANVASLVLTRGIGRQREMAVRTALGAPRGRIVQQLTVESLLLAGLAGAAGLFLGWVGSRVLVALSMGVFAFGETTMDGRVVAFTAALSGVTALLFGLAPAWQAAASGLQTRGELGGRRQNRVRSVLVVAEVAMAVVLLVGAGLLLRTFAKLAEVRLGLQPEHAVTMRTVIFGPPAARWSLMETILDRVEGLPNVKAAGIIQFLPLSGMTNRGPFHFVGRPAPADPRAVESDVSTVSRGYFAAVGTEVVRGRVFGREDQMQTRRVAVVNQVFVNRYSRDEEPIGRLIQGDWADPKPTEIIGVVGDVRHNGVDQEPRATVFLAQSQTPGYITYLVVRTTTDAAAMTAAVRREVRQVDPRQPMTDAQPLQAYVDKAMARPRLHANFLTGVACLALFLAAVGLYGLLAYVVGQRTREIGLRMALGARPGEILAGTVWQGTRLVLLGLAVGTVGAMLGSQVLRKYVYGVELLDPITYLSVAGVLLVAAAAAAMAPAVRAARVDPMAALRMD